MVRSVIALGAAVATIGVISAGPLSAASPGSEVPGDDIAAQQVARLLLVDTLDEDEQRWEPDRLAAFVDRLETDRTEALDIEVVDDVTGPALAVAVDAFGDGVAEVCVISDGDGQPTSAGRPCADG